MHLPWPVIAGLQVFLNKKCMALPAKSGGVRLRLQQILQKVAAKAAMPNFSATLQSASGSASELEYHFLLAKDLGFMAVEEYKKLDESTIEVKRMLAGLIKKVETDRKRF
jgi:23S rRNA-intervening sequence protein